MDTDADEPAPEPDLAQLLVLETGPIPEDLTTDLALTFPLDNPECLKVIEAAGPEASIAVQLLQAMLALSKQPKSKKELALTR